MTSFAPVTTPVQIFTDAKEMAGDLLVPARRRAVISRAYYAAYHASRQRAGEFERDPDQSGGLHAQFIRMLRASSDATLKAVGDRLYGLYARRIVADYQLAAIVPKQMALDAIEDAEEIIFDLLGNELPEATTGETA